MESIWNKLNSALNESERFEFNQWRVRVHAIADKLRDNDQHRVDASELMRELCKIPRLEK